MGTILPDALGRELAVTGTDEKRSLVAAIRATMADEMSPARGEPGARPRCGHARVVRRGRDRGGSQRWLCRGCGPASGGRTLSVMGRSRLPGAAWPGHAVGMADGPGLRALAGRCRVRPRTSWLVRTRLCEAVAARPGPFRSGPGVPAGVDGTMLHESFSGNASRGALSTPGRARRTYRDLHVSGVSGQLACVVCGANGRGDASCELVGRAHGTSGPVLAALSGRVGPGTALATDGLPAYGGVAAALGVEREARPARGGAQLGMASAPHKRLADLLRPLDGVATRRPQRYLSWFCRAEQSRRGDADRRGLACREARSGTYETTLHGPFDEPRPFMEYWERRGVSTVV